MKQLLSLLALLLAPALAMGGEDTGPDVTLTRRDGSVETYRSADRSREAIFKLLENVCEQKAATPGRQDSVFLHRSCTSGIYDILDISRLARFETTDWDTEILMRAQHDPDGPPENRSLKPGSPAIEFGVGPEPLFLRRLHPKFECYNLEEDGAGIGHGDRGDGDNLNKLVVIAEDCWLEGVRCDWLTYWWTPGRCDITFRTSAEWLAKGKKSRWDTNRLALSIAENNDDQQNVTMLDLDIFLDANGSQSFGYTSDPHPTTGGLMGNLHRSGGLWTMRGVRIKAKGLAKQYNSKWTVPRIAIFTNQYYTENSGRTLKTDFKDVQIEIEPGIVKEVYDLDFRRGVKVSIDNSKQVADAQAAQAAIAESNKQKLKQVLAEGQAMYDAASKAIVTARGGTGVNGEFRVWQGAK